MAKILVISAHQDLQQSISNRLILADLEQHFGSDLSVRRLSDLYPDYRIDVTAEQAALVEADIVVLQYPTYWFNTPAILKKWLDDVWTYGFAYGTGGDKLHGKKLFVSTTTGSPKEVYDGNTAPLIADLVKSVEASASMPALPGTVSSRSTTPSTFRAYTATLIWHKPRRVLTITPATSARKSSNCSKQSQATKKQPFRLLFCGSLASAARHQRVSGSTAAETGCGAGCGGVVSRVFNACRARSCGQ